MFIGGGLCSLDSFMIFFLFFIFGDVGFMGFKFGDFWLRRRGWLWLKLILFFIGCIGIAFGLFGGKKVIVWLIIGCGYILEIIRSLKWGIGLACLWESNINRQILVDDVNVVYFLTINFSRHWYI